MSVCFILLLLSCVKVSLGYFITVDAHAEECFFDKVPAKAKMGTYKNKLPHLGVSRRFLFLFNKSN